MKNAIFGLVILVVLGIGGFYFLNSRALISKTPQELVKQQLGKKDGIFGSVKDALSKSLSLKCVYKDESGTETTTYIKNGSVRIMMTNANENQEYNNILMKEKKMYMWSDKSKTGFVYETIDPKDMTPYPTFKVEKGLEPEKAPGNQQQDSIIAEIEKYKNACKTESISDSLFELPNDVEFEDMAAMQKKMMENIPGANGQGMDQADYEKYINEMMPQGAGQ